MIIGYEFYINLFKGQEADFSQAEIFHCASAKKAHSERLRCSALDFSVCQGVPTRAIREAIKKTVGSDLIFVILYLPLETHMERLKGRHDNLADETTSDELTQSCLRTNAFFERKGVDETNAIEIVIQKDMSPQDVADAIINSI